METALDAPPLSISFDVCDELHAEYSSEATVTVTWLELEQTQTL